MNTFISDSKHPVPEKYQQSLYIGEIDRKGVVIDFKVPPVVVDSPMSMTEYGGIITNDHVDAAELPLVYENPKYFILLRPTALPYRLFVREQLIEAGLSIQEEFPLDNFMKLADALYWLDPGKSFHLQWRIIMRAMHDTGIQNQNTAFAFVFNPQKGQHCQTIIDIKTRLRLDMGETPVVVKYKGDVKIALGIHHLHSPDENRLSLEYNALMHAKNKTSVFSV